MLAQQEYERFLEVQNRLNQIKAFQQLKNGELFLETINLNSQQESADHFDWSPIPQSCEAKDVAQSN